MICGGPEWGFSPSSLSGLLQGRACAWQACVQRVPEPGARRSWAGGSFGLWPVTCGSGWQQILSAMGLSVASEGGDRCAWRWDSLTIPLPFAELIGHQTGVNVQTRWRSRAASGGLHLCGCQSCRQAPLLPSEGFPSSLIPQPVCSRPSSPQGLLRPCGDWKSGPCLAGTRLCALIGWKAVSRWSRRRGRFPAVL